MTMANIKLGDDVAIHPALTEVITTLAIDMPSWEFNSSHSMKLMRDDNTDPLHDKQVTYGFTISTKGEMLGTIHLDRWARVPKFVVHNNRIQRAKERGYGMSTTNAGKAVKLAKKWFSTAKLEDRVTDARIVATTKLDQATREARYATNEVWSSSMERMAMNYLAKDWGTFLSYLRQDPRFGGHHKLEAFPDLLDHKHRADRAQYYFYHNQAYLVMVEGDNYVLIRNDKDVLPVIKGMDEVSPYIRQHIGMLKLMDFNKDKAPPVTEYGVRASENSFIIIDEGSDMTWLR